MSSPTRVLIDPKRVAETVTPIFDFFPKMYPSESLGLGTCTVAVWSGVDPNPMAMVGGITLVPPSVIQPMLQGGLAGVVYLITVTAAASGRPIVLEGLLAVLPEGM